jgi:hypothetical protein
MNRKVKVVALEDKSIKIIITVNCAMEYMFFPKLH